MSVAKSAKPKSHIGNLSQQIVGNDFIKNPRFPKIKPPLGVATVN